MGRRAIAGLGILLLLGCSGDDDGSASPFGGAEATTTTTATDGLDESDSSDLAEEVTNADDENPDPAIAEGGGWRLAVREPTAGLAIESHTNLCVEISAPTREPEVALDVRLRPGGSFEDSVSTHLAATAGANALPVDLPEPEEGFVDFLKYDLDVQIVADGAPDLAATVVGITITGETFDEVTCD